MNERSKHIRRETIKLMYEHGMSHYGGSLSCVEILIALYDHILTKDDVFLLSKGHSCAPMYVLLRDKGLNPEINHHPKYDTANGINMTSGSLGHGLPFGIGVALAKKIKGETGMVYVLLGDGETTEGTFFESMLILHKLQLRNIRIIVDDNHIQGSDWCHKILFNSFLHGFAINICKGNKLKSVIKSLTNDNHWLSLCETIKGKGVSFMENDPSWHSRQLTVEQYQQAIKELS